MTFIVVAVAGYLIGSAPTANALARLRGIDLRTQGTGNPGTNNARNLGGYGLAGSVLVVELAKGFIAARLGMWIGGETSAVVCGSAAVAGNVYNAWYRLRGGKGLAIGAGVLLALWPAGFITGVIVVATLARLTRSSGWAAIGVLTALIILALVSWGFDFPTWWGIKDQLLLTQLAIVMAVLTGPKHLRDARNDVSSPSRPSPSAT